MVRTREPRVWAQGSRAERSPATLCTSVSSGDKHVKGPDLWGLEGRRAQRGGRPRGAHRP